MIECSEHPDNEGTCIYCLNEVVAQRDDRERRWREAEAKLREVSILLRQCFAHARRFRDQEVSTPALERDWERVAGRIRQTLEEELPPSEQGNPVAGVVSETYYRTAYEHGAEAFKRGEPFSHCSKHYWESVLYGNLGPRGWQNGWLDAYSVSSRLKETMP